MPDEHTPTPPRLAVLLSGGGRTLLNLADAIDQRRLRAVIDLVIASKDGPGVDRARERGFEARVIPGEIPAETLDQILAPRGVSWIVLAGYLKKVRIPPRYTGRVVNIHPALLPKFGGPGMHGRHVHAAVIAAREPVSGCTVHLCDEHYDTGPIILQNTVPVLPDDTPDTLAARVFQAECDAYPKALAMLIATPHH